MSDIRDKARQILAQVPEAGEVRSNRDAALFKKLTNGVTHDVLMENWKAGGIRTVCIDFVCWYAAQMGIDILSSIPKKLKDPKVDGFFALKETLIKGGFGHAFVPATRDGAAPKCGDIVRHTAFHVDIALGLDDKNFLLRVAGGQSSHPRPAKDVSKEFDNILRVRGSAIYQDSFQKLQGWLDIEKFFPPPAEHKVPEETKTGHLWFNGDGDLVHPDAPVGSGGLGTFRAAGVVCGLAYEAGPLPHPDSPFARTLDPQSLPDRS